MKMKEIATDIDFADSSFRSCEMIHDKLTVYLNSWDDKTLKLVFPNTIEFVYKAGSIPVGIYEKSDELSLLNEALSLYYEKTPKTHPFKVFAMTDIEDFVFLKVVAENVVVTKE